MKNTRSNKFDYFTGDNNPEKKKRTALKKVWYWLKILIYVFIFGVTLTGCVQNFVITTAGVSGNGLEFYLSKKDVAPRVTTYKKSDSSTIFDDKKEVLTRLPLLTEEKSTNFFLNNRSVIEKLREQATSNNGKYGEYGGLSSSIRIIETKKDANGKEVTEELSNSPVFTENGRYLYRANSSTTYKPVTKIEPIYVPAIVLRKGPDGKPQVTPNIETNKDDPQQITWVSGLSVVPTELPISPNQPSSSYTPDQLKSNVMYARDVFQSLYNQTFKDPKWTAIFNGKTPGEFYKQDIIDKFSSGAPSGDLRITELQKYALIEYAKVMNVYAKDLGIAAAPLARDAVDKYQTNNDSNFIFNFGEKHDTFLPLSGTSLQKPITTWGEAWELGPFYGLVVYPFAVFTQVLRQSMPYLSGWSTIFSIIIVVVITKLLTFGITFKSIVGQSIQEDLRGKKAQIEAKYVGFEKNKTMKMRKQQELQRLYKKHNVNPLDQFLGMIIAMPIFLSMWRIVQGIPEIKSTYWLGLNFSSTSYQSLFAGEIQYLWILIVASVVQILSQLFPRFLNRKRLKQRISISESQALKKSEKTQRIVMIVFVVMTVIFSAAVQVYWTISAIFTIIQAYSVYRLKKTTWWRTKYSLKYK